MLDGSFRLIGPGLALILLATASACGDGGDKPRTLPPVSQTPVSSSITPTPTALEVEALTFGRHFFDDINSMLATGNTAGYRADIAPSCPCHQLADYVEKVYKSGRLDGARYVIQSIAPAGTYKRALAAVQVRFSNPAATRLDSGGHIVERLAAVPHREWIMSLVKDANNWHVTVIKETPP